MVSKSPPWPTSAARVMTSTPISSIIQRTATEVSRPPLYASTTRFATSISASARLKESKSGQGRQPLCHFGAARLLGGHHQNGVVTGHGADDVGQSSPVDGRCDHVGGTGRRPYHHQIGGVGHLDHPLAEHPFEVFLGFDALLELRYGV